MEKDLILDASHALTYDEIFTYINEPALSWWQEINTFIQQKYQVSPKIAYSKCSAQKGWNVKYQKSGKSICTLYPENESFIVLVVIKLELADIIKAMPNAYEPAVLRIVSTAQPFNGTKWLMIPVESEAILKSVQELLVFKQEMGTAKKLPKAKADKVFPVKRKRQQRSD